MRCLLNELTESSESCLRSVGTGGAWATDFFSADLVGAAPPLADRGRPFCTISDALAAAGLAGCAYLDSSNPLL